jgi:hypothetical protein
MRVRTKMSAKRARAVALAAGLVGITTVVVCAGPALATGGSRGMAPTPAAREDDSACRSDLGILGSWRVKVHFLTGLYAGRTATTVQTFTQGAADQGRAGGGLVEANPDSDLVNAGAWKATGCRSFSFTLVENFFGAPDPANGYRALERTLVINGSGVVSGDTWTTTGNTGTFYDPTGAVLPRPGCDLPGGVGCAGLSNAAAERLDIGWTPPTDDN